MLWVGSGGPPIRDLHTARLIHTVFVAVWEIYEWRKARYMLSKSAARGVRTAARLLSERFFRTGSCEPQNMDVVASLHFVKRFIHAPARRKDWNKNCATFQNEEPS
ncbi:hypothetical protein AVEN_121044-1 [Araneus ventricosus]|uniref:Uncharacterized protein n=1 Tax=Araneus ventricosus TaxID=182803 RepID=A0A4Y2F4B3_ARAVE|nr:hypothetical protein AVEN_121044-1 [Araneus ventricosus]